MTDHQIFDLGDYTTSHITISRGYGRKGARAGVAVLSQLMRRPGGPS